MQSHGVQRRWENNPLPCTKHSGPNAAPGVLPDLNASGACLAGGASGRVPRPQPPLGASRLHTAPGASVSVPWAVLGSYYWSIHPSQTRTWSVGQARTRHPGSPLFLLCQLLGHSVSVECQNVKWIVGYNAGLKCQIQCQYNSVLYSIHIFFSLYIYIW